jgi:hypothetical protein
MDIFEQAKKMDADYLDNTSGYIYRIQNYNHCKRLGLPTLGIQVIDSANGEEIGWIPEPDR